MKILRRDVDRKEVIDFYIRTDSAKKGKIIPPDYGSLNWNDPDTLDWWLCQHGYKFGIMPGYKKWACVQLSKEDLMDTAIVSGIFSSPTRRLGDLVGTEEFKAWKPTTESSKTWYEPLSQGVIPENCAIILRPAVKSERSKYYAEDGSGRSICYLRAIRDLNLDSEMPAYIGYGPDSDSNFMKKRFSELLNGSSPI